ncbi:histidine phosphatase family protein [Fibrobacter succinogenes]|uniref:histidine phosphatase family protein n=1 Tax=Fibrobacter succinogenes TaxID=833 RepID=UPI0015692D4E|nr:histidine phosphatase family protein [Fibrobacter succinogenes]
MHKISRISLAFSGALLSAALLGACSDDNATTPFVNTAATSSSSIQVIAPDQSSSSEATTTSSDSQLQQQSSSSSETLLPPPLSSSSATSTEPTCVETPVATIAVDSLGLADLADVFKSVRCNEKAVFVIRHGERSDGDHTKYSPLTYWENETADSVAGQPTDGVRQAIAVGKKLISADEFTYTHTKYLRTEQTCFYINQGRGQATFPHDSTEIYSISWFKKDSERYDFYKDSTTNVRLVISGWAYDNLYADAFYDLKEKSEEIIKTHIAPDYASMNKFRVICSHDDFILPLSVFASNGTVNYRFHDPASRHWPYFLTGVAVIIDDKNQIRYVSFKGLGIGAE